MASDQVRQASKVLGPLLRRRGTSPALGTSLRRALQALDKSFSGLSPQAQDETIEAGITELRNCVELIRQSDRPADHEQLEGINKALALLAPAEEAPAEVPLPALVLAPPSQAAAAVGMPSAEIRADAQGAAKRRQAQAPASDFKVAGELLARLDDDLQNLHVILSEPLFRLEDLYTAIDAMQRQIRTVKWLGRDRIPDFLQVADMAKSLKDKIAAALALVYMGEARGAEMLIGILGKAAAEKQPLPETSATLLRTISGADLLDWLLKVFLKPAHPTVCGLLLPLLAEQNLLSSEQIWGLVNHAKDEIAVQAALALPWTDGAHDIPLLLSWAHNARTTRRANALFFAAAMLGSAAALAEIRARVQKGEALDYLLVDALAIAGDRTDATLLTTLAANPDLDATYLLLAAAHLGCTETLQTLPQLAESVPSDVADEVRRILTGHDSQAGDESAQPDKAIRVLHGEPWSVAGLIARLEASDETLQSQRRMALELRVRTGQVPLSTLPMLLPDSSRTELLANWNSYFAKANGKLKPGDWYYQGKPMA
jgi:hypothetical protein